MPAPPNRRAARPAGDVMQPSETQPSDQRQALDRLNDWERRVLLCLFDASIGEWVALRVLREEFHHPGSRFSRAIKRLRDQQWISVRRDPAERRQRAVRLTVQARHRLKPALGTATYGVLWPRTTRRQYLTGPSALNIPSPEGTGDWHLFETFQGTHGRAAGRFFVAGDNIKSSSDIFGDERIYDASAILKQAGIDAPSPLFAADHYRAMADLLRRRLAHGLSLDSCDADEWFPAEADKAQLRLVLERLAAGIPPEQSERLRAWMRCNKV